MGKPSAPAAPDYRGAAQAEGQAGVQSAIVNAILNRANQSSPYGSQIWRQTGTTQIPGVGDQPGVSVPNYESSIQFTPEGQQLFDADTRIRLGLADASQQSLGQVQSSLSTPFDLSGLPGDYSQKVADAMYGRATATLDPQWAQAEERERNRLLNAGFSVGNEGWTKALDDFNRNKSLAYGDARDRSIVAGTEFGQRDRNQAISELLLQRTQPLSELNALRTGATPQIPTFGSTNVGANAQPANLLGATQAEGQAANDIYNSKVGTYNSTLGAVAGLGAGALAMFF
jgi:hypothetical protein